MKSPPLLVVLVAVVTFCSLLWSMDENEASSGLRMLTTASTAADKNLWMEEVGKMPKMILSPENTNGICNENAVVYMAQKHHSSYDRDSYGLLKKSLDLLYKNYLNENHNNNTSVFIFHTGEFEHADLMELENREGITKGIMRLVDLTNTSFWHLPPWLRKDDPNKWSQPTVYSVGYRHMIRWYAVRMWDYFKRLNNESNCNFKYIMRMDEESFIYSPIKYNIFSQMTEKNWVYGYRSCSFEMKHVDKLWIDYAKKRPSIVPKRNFVEQNLCGFYNNWFVSDINFFLSPPVQDFLRYADHSGSMYRQRRNDLILQTAAVYAFAEPTSVHRFLDFTYQHFTEYHDSGCPMWGSLATGHDDPQGHVVADNLVKELKGMGCPKEGEAFKFTSVDIHQNDLSPSYHHLPAGNLTLRHIKAGLVDVPNKGLFSG